MKFENNVLYGSIDLAFTVLLIVIFFIRYGLKHRPSVKYDYFTTIPDGMSPAEVNAYLRHNNPGSKAIVATILDLSTRGFLKFEAVVKKSGFFRRGKLAIRIKITKKEDIGIKKYEKELLNFIERAYNSCPDIKEYINMNKEYMHDFRNEWGKLVKESIYESFPQYFETAPSAVKVTLLTLSTLNVLWAALSCLKNEFYQLLFILPCIVICLFGIQIFKRRSQKGADVEECWKAFKRFFKEFSKFNRNKLPELNMLGKYIIYAEALGVSKQVLKQLPLIFPEIKDGYYGSWFNCYSYIYSKKEGIEAFSSLNNFLESLSRSLESV